MVLSSNTCASSVLRDLCIFLRKTKIIKIHLQSNDILHPGYVVRVGRSIESPLELELIESLVLGENGRFATREEIYQILSDRYHQFNLEMFESCVAEFLRIEQGLADGSIRTKPCPFA